MLIRQLQPQDAEQAFRLRVAAFAGGAAAYDPDEIYLPDAHRLVAVDGGRVVGHLGVWPFRQAFLGHAVPMGGVGAVAVAADRRGGGIGSRLLAAALDHMGSAGMAISTLYASTPLPYRRWGWEYAGAHIRRRVATRDLLDLPAPRHAVDLRPHTPADLGALADVQDALALTEPGGLVSGERWLARALQTDPDEATIAAVATRGGSPVGLALARKTATDHADDHSSFGLEMLRLFGVDRDVERALWRFVGHHHPVAATTLFRSRPAEPLLLELPHGLHLRGLADEHFMTRLVDAPAAIAARGWPGLSASVELEVIDDRRPANSGRFVLEIDDRRGALSRGGAGRVAVDIGALSSLYTGFVRATDLARAGRLPGASGRDLTALDDAFTAPAPFLRAYF